MLENDCIAVVLTTELRSYKLENEILFKWALLKDTKGAFVINIVLLLLIAADVGESYIVEEDEYSLTLKNEEIVSVFVTDEDIPMLEDAEDDVNIFMPWNAGYTIMPEYWGTFENNECSLIPWDDGDMFTFEDNRDSFTLKDDQILRVVDDENSFMKEDEANAFMTDGERNSGVLEDDWVLLTPEEESVSFMSEETSIMLILESDEFSFISVSVETPLMIDDNGNSSMFEGDLYTDEDDTKEILSSWEEFSFVLIFTAEETDISSTTEIVGTSLMTDEGEFSLLDEDNEKMFFIEEDWTSTEDNGSPVMPVMLEDDLISNIPTDDTPCLFENVLTFSKDTVLCLWIEVFKSENDGERKLASVSDKYIDDTITLGSETLFPSFDKEKEFKSDIDDIDVTKLFPPDIKISELEGEMSLIFGTSSVEFLPV